MNQKNNNVTEKSFLNCVTESEMVRGKNGVALFNEWRRVEEPDDCSRMDIARANRLGRV